VHAQLSQHDEEQLSRQVEDRSGANDSVSASNDFPSDGFPASLFINIIFEVSFSSSFWERKQFERFSQKIC
jgi:hypothetical protein